MKISRSGWLLTCILFVLLATVSFAQEQEEEIKYPNWFLGERVLTSLKFKLTKNFTVGGWTAGYWGSSFYPSRDKFDPKVFIGYDIVPGFEVAVGKLFANVKLSLGGDFYYMARQYNWKEDPYPYHSRARGNIILTTPFAGKMTLQFIQRFEDIYQRRILFGKIVNNPPDNFVRKRSTLKVTGPQFTQYKLAPYVYYEGFKSPDGLNEPYYYETEYGVTLSPFKNFNMNLAHQIQSRPEEDRFVAHQINLYLFYLIDLTH